MKMQTFKILCIGYLMILFSCERAVPKPDDLIDKNEFITILEQTYLYKNLNRKWVGQSALDYTEQQAYILQSHNVSWEQFKESYAYYMTDEKSEEEIYSKVKKRLELLASEKKNEKTEEKVNEVKEKIQKKVQDSPQMKVKPSLDIPTQLQKRKDSIKNKMALDSIKKSGKKLK